MVTISEGKLKSLEAVSNEKGVITAAAMDQRGSLQKSIAIHHGTSSRRQAVTTIARCRLRNSEPCAAFDRYQIVRTEGSRCH